MEGMFLELSTWQRGMLDPLFKKSRKAFDLKKPVMILAQVFEGSADDKNGFLDIRIIPHELCPGMQKIVGTKPGFMADRDVTVWAPEDDDHNT